MGSFVKATKSFRCGGVLPVFCQCVPVRAYIGIKKCLLTVESACDTGKRNDWVGTFTKLRVGERKVALRQGRILCYDCIDEN